MIVKKFFLFEFTISLQTIVYSRNISLVKLVFHSLANSNMWDLLVRIWQKCPPPHTHKHTHTHTHTHTNVQYMSQLGVGKK